MKVGMFAAGNLYTGEFLELSMSGGLGAQLNWGTPFTARPRALKGYYAYSPAVIHEVKAPYENLEGQMDKCQLLVILTDMDDPFMVDTALGKFFDQTPTRTSSHTPSTRAMRIPADSTGSSIWNWNTGDRMRHRNMR